MPSPKIKLPHVPVEFECLNCAEKFTVTERPKIFCTTRCANDAKLVRYVRAASADGRIDKPDVRQAIQVKFGFALADAEYDEKARYVSPERRAEVIARDQGNCRKCGKPGTDIDHIKGDSGDLDNLQLLCQLCHLEKTITNMTPIADDEKKQERKARYTQLMIRIQAKNPLRICDNETDWESGFYHPAVRERWATMMETRKAALSG